MENFIELQSHITGYHIYQEEWVPTVGESLRAEREPDNVEDLHAVCVRKNGRIVGHLERGVSGRFAQLIFFFLRAHQTSRCTVTVTGPPVNLGDMMGMKVPCKIRLTGRQQLMEILESQLSDLHLI